MEAIWNHLKPGDRGKNTCIYRFHLNWVTYYIASAVTHVRAGEVSLATSWCRLTEVNFRSSLSSVEATLKKECVSRTFFQPVLLPFLQQEGDVLSQQDKIHAKVMSTSLNLLCNMLDKILRPVSIEHDGSIPYSLNYSPTTRAALHQ